MTHRSLQMATLSIAVGLSSCAAGPRIDDLSSAERARISQIQIFKGSADKPVRPLGEVSGLSCQKYKDQPHEVTEAEALEGLRIRAAVLGADAVVNTACQRKSEADWTNNCWASVKCIGDAAKLL